MTGFQGTCMETIELEPQTSSCTFYECVPPEIICRLDEYLSFEDSCNFQESSQYVNNILAKRWHHYDKIQVSDDSSDCFIQCTSGRLPKRLFSENNLCTVLTKCSKITQVVLVIKEMGCLDGPFDDKRVRLLKETSLYHKGGYVGNFFSRVPPDLMSRLKTLSLHVDIMRESFSELWFHCPQEDLRYCIEHLSSAKFDTFVQVSFCSATMTNEDAAVRNFLLGGMEQVLKEMTTKNAKTDFGIDMAEGYVDMTIEKGNLEYSFAFFYYNPQICEPPSSDDDSEEAAVDEGYNSSFYYEGFPMDFINDPTGDLAQFYVLV